MNVLKTLTSAECPCAAGGAGWGGLGRKSFREAALLFLQPGMLRARALSVSDLNEKCLSSSSMSYSHKRKGPVIPSCNPPFSSFQRRREALAHRLYPLNVSELPNFPTTSLYICNPKTPSPRTQSQPPPVVGMCHSRASTAISKCTRTFCPGLRQPKCLEKSSSATCLTVPRRTSNLFSKGFVVGIVAPRVGRLGSVVYRFGGRKEVLGAGVIVAVVADEANG